MVLSAMMLTAAAPAIAMPSVPTRVYAASTGNWYVSSFNAKETTSHKVYSGNVNDYTESAYRNTGIQIYSPVNTGSNYLSDGVRVSSNTFTIDFTNANDLYYGSNIYENFKIDTKYEFNIYNSSGSCVWYERFSSTDPLGSDSVTQRYYGYGISTITRNLDGTSLEDLMVDLSKFGKRSVTLSDGSYTIKIIRSYVWFRDSSPLFGIYQSESEMNGTLLVDSTIPTVTMKTSSGSPVSNGAYVNSNVVVTASDTNLSGLYYKTPGASYYSYASNSYTTAGTNGWYYVYGRDNVYNESDVYSFYLDTVIPTGAIKVGSSTLASGSTTSSAFSFTASDSGSGIANVYYKTPSSSSYTTYIPGTIIPNTAGDGIYYFYCTDKAGNASSTYSVRLDSTKPTGTFKVNGVTVPSGSITNQSFTYNGTDSGSGVGACYVKLPGTDEYRSYPNGALISSTAGDGMYCFYAMDKIGNVSEVANILLDTTKPTGTVSSGGKAVSNGSYISGAFTYNAVDNGSGISKIYCKSPVSGAYIEYSNGSIIPNSAGDGWYEFYSVDNAGNISNVTRVFLETSIPAVSFYRNGEITYSSNMTDGERYDTGIYLNRDDVLKIICSTSSGNVTSNYSLNTNYVIDERYENKDYVVSITSATGIKSEFVYHVILDKPHIMIDSKSYDSGETLYFNEDKDVSFLVDSIQENDAKTGAVINGTFYSYASLSTKRLTANEGEERKYDISMNDLAGNISTFTIIIDKDSPKATWKTSSGKAINNGAYTNSNVYLSIDEQGLNARYSYNGGEYLPYNGETFSNEGAYTVVLTDRAENKSTYTVNIDKTAPKGRFYSDYNEVDNNTVTNGQIYFTWDDDSTCSLNGRSYSKNTVIAAEGIYHFTLTDRAGNSSTYSIEIDLTAPKENYDVIESLNNHVVSKWFNVTYGGSKTSFASYVEALDYACSLEFANSVTSLELVNASDFTQTHLIASGEVHEGTYYRYKAQSNPSNELYYFDYDALMEVVKSYAKAYISDVNYYNGAASNLGIIGNENMYSDVWTSDGVNAKLINGYCFINGDSTEVYARLSGTSEWTPFSYGVEFDEQFHQTGLYEIKEIDRAGNEIVYNVFLDLSSPDLLVNAEVFGDESSRTIVISEEGVSSISAYYYKTFDIKSILDNDPYAVVSVTNNKETRYYSKGDELPCLDEGGKYDISVYDRLGNKYSFTVYIVGNEAAVKFTNNSEDTAFNINITLEQDFDAIVSLEIYKDGVKLDGVSPDITNYTFTKDGTYEVIIRDNFGRIITKAYKFDKALPIGHLSCDNDTKTNDSVSFTFDNSKYYVEIYKDGALIGKDTSGAVSYNSDGSYSIKLINIDDEDNFSVYSFVIDTKAPTVSLTGVEAGGSTNSNVSIAWEDSDVESATYTLNGVERGRFDNNTTFTEEGTYVVTVSDELGNKTVKTFTIDKSLDYSVYDLSGIEATGTDMTTSGNVVIFNNEELHIEVTKNGENYDYNFEESLTEEGYYNIRIYDDLGNSSTFTIVIDKSVDYNSNVVDGSTTNGDVYFVTGEKSTIIVTKDGNPCSYNWGERLTEEGEYFVTMYDAFGNEKTVSFTIDKSVDYSANISDGSSTNNDVVIDDNESSKIIVTKDGEEYNYSFGDVLSEDGSYIVTIEDEFGNSETINFTIDKTAPEITLNGIDDGGKDNVSVSITDMSEEGEIHVYKDGVEIEYELGQELSEYGSYKVEVKDNLGNTRTYSFELAFKMNGWAIALIAIGIVSIGGLICLILMKKRKTFKSK